MCLAMPIFYNHLPQNRIIRLLIVMRDRAQGTADGIDNQGPSGDLVERLVTGSCTLLLFFPEYGESAGKIASTVEQAFELIIRDVKAKAVDVLNGWIGALQGAADAGVTVWYVSSERKGHLDPTDAQAIGTSDFYTG